MHTVNSDNSTTVTAPTRFREAEARGHRLSRGLRLMGRVPAGVDEPLMARIGRGLVECDEAGARLADAIQTRANGRVSMKQLHTALSDGIDAVPDGPQALRDFMDVVAATPHWVDWGAVDRGAEVLTRLGRTAADVLLQLSLIGGYRFGGPADLLVATGGLTGDQTLRRLAETQHWTVSLSRPGALRPGNEAWRLTVHVRAMHALVNANFSKNWDSRRFGLPINMSDQAGTLGLFDGTLIIGSRAVGARLHRQDAADLMHLWKYVGWLLGVEADFLTDNEWERHRINTHILLAAGAQTSAGPVLARASLAAQRQRHYVGWPAGLQRFRGRYEQERVLSMMSVFLGRRSMRDLELAVRPPWAFATAAVSNLWWHHVIGRLPGGRTYLLRRGRRIIDRIQRSYFHDADEGLADLPG